jgi:hypothetical protein
MEIQNLAKRSKGWKRLGGTRSKVDSCLTQRGLVWHALPLSWCDVNGSPDTLSSDFFIRRNEGDEDPPAQGTVIHQHPPASTLVHHHLLQRWSRFDELWSGHPSLYDSEFWNWLNVGV